MGIRNHNHATIRALVFYVGTIVLASAAVFLPWFRWSEPTWLTADGRWLTTTNLNYLLPAIAVGTEEAIGAQTQDGNLALNIGRTARVIILGICAWSFWQLLQHRIGRYQLFLPVLLLCIFLCLFSYVVVNNLIIEEVILENEKTLPYIIGIEWSGPTSLISAMLLQMLALLLPNRARAALKGA